MAARLVAKAALNTIQGARQNSPQVSPPGPPPNPNPMGQPGAQYPTYQNTQYPPHHDPKAYANLFASSDKTVYDRKEVVILYGLLLLMYFTTMSIICGLTFIEQFQTWIRKTPDLYLGIGIAFVLLYIIMLIFTCAADLGIWYGALYVLFTAMLAFLLGVTCSFFNNLTLLFAVNSTIFTCLLVIIYASYSSIDFMGWRSYLFFALITFIAAGIQGVASMKWIWKPKIYDTIYGGIMALLWSLYLCRETHHVLRRDNFDVAKSGYYPRLALHVHLDLILNLRFCLVCLGLDECRRRPNEAPHGQPTQYQY